MIKRLGQIFLGLSGLAVAAWLLPALYELATIRPEGTPFTLYSPVVHDFTAMAESDRELRFTDRKGRVYGDTVQPLFYASLLASKGTLPDSLDGVALSLEEIERHFVIASSDPADVNLTLPPVWPLMESTPLRLELREPTEAMVSRRDRIDIYDMNGNALEEAKTQQLRCALAACGFAYPARLFAGRPTDRKDYDEGYLVTDARDELFQIKQVDGQMTVRHFPEAASWHPRYLMITEFDDHATLGYLVSADGCLLMLTPEGSVIPTGVPFSPETDDFLLIGDLLYYTVKTSTSAGEHFYALRADDFSIIATMDRPYGPERQNLCRWFLPFRLQFTAPTDSWVRPRLSDFSWIGLLVDAVLLLALLLIRKRNR